MREGENDCYGLCVGGGSMLLMRKSTGSWMEGARMGETNNVDNASDVGRRRALKMAMRAVILCVSLYITWTWMWYLLPPAQARVQLAHFFVRVGKDSVDVVALPGESVIAFVKAGCDVCYRNRDRIGELAFAMGEDARIIVPRQQDVRAIGDSLGGVPVVVAVDTFEFTRRGIDAVPTFVRIADGHIDLSWLGVPNKGQVWLSRHVRGYR